MDIDFSPSDSDALLSLLQSVKLYYQPPPPAPRKRGKQRDFSALSFLLLAVVALVTRTFGDRQLHKLLSKDDGLRLLLGFVRVPHRTTIGRRLASLVPEAEAQIAALGQQIIHQVKPQSDH